MLLVFFILLFAIVSILFLYFSKLDFKMNFNYQKTDTNKNKINYDIDIFFILFDLEFLRCKLFHIDDKYFKFLFFRKDVRLLYLKILEALENTSLKFDVSKIKQMKNMKFSVNSLYLESEIFLIDSLITAKVIGDLYIIFYMFLGRRLELKKISFDLKQLDSKNNIFGINTNICIDLDFRIKNFILSIIK